MDHLIALVKDLYLVSSAFAEFLPIIYLLFDKYFGKSVENDIGEWL